MSGACGAGHRGGDVHEVRAWLDERLPRLLHEYHVPGAAWAVSHGGQVVDGTRVLAPGTAARMHGREVDLPELGLMGTSWGLGFERFDTPTGTIIGHDGSTIGQGAFLRMVPEAGLAVALLTNGGDVVSLYRDVVGHVLAELSDVALLPAARSAVPPWRPRTRPSSTTTPRTPSPHSTRLPGPPSWQPSPPSHGRVRNSRLGQLLTMV